MYRYSARASTSHDTQIEQIGTLRDHYILLGMALFQGANSGGNKPSSMQEARSEITKTLLFGLIAFFYVPERGVCNLSKVQILFGLKGK